MRFVRLARILPSATLLLTLVSGPGAGRGCDMEIRAHADVPVGDSHTLHVNYRSGAPSTAREPSRP
jgi:hypothetical protein